MMTLSAWSRITSSSNSFQPSTDSSIRTSRTGDSERPCSTTRRNSSGVRAQPPAGTTQGEGGAHDDREPDLAPAPPRRPPSSARCPSAAPRAPISSIACLKSSRSSARRTACLAGADQLDAPLVENAAVRERQREVQRGLASDRRQDRVRALPFDDPLQELEGERLDVRRVGQLRIRHDRRRIRVDQNDAIPLALERADGLRARVVELAGLADDDRPRADDEDAGDVGAPGHSGEIRVLAPREQGLSQAAAGRRSPRATTGSLVSPDHARGPSRLQVLGQTRRRAAVAAAQQDRPRAPEREQRARRSRRRRTGRWTCRRARRSSSRRRRSRPARRTLRPRPAATRSRPRRRVPPRRPRSARSTRGRPGS